MRELLYWNSLRRQVAVAATIARAPRGHQDKQIGRTYRRVLASTAAGWGVAQAVKTLWPPPALVSFCWPRTRYRREGGREGARERERERERYPRQAAGGCRTERGTLSCREGDDAVGWYLKEAVEGTAPAAGGMKPLYPQAGRQMQSQNRASQVADASGIAETTSTCAAGSGGELQLKRSPSCTPPTAPTQPPELSAAAPTTGCGVEGSVSEEALQQLVELQRRRVAERNAEQAQAQSAKELRIQREQRARREVHLGGGQWCCATSQSPRTVTSREVMRAQKTNRGHLKHRQEVTTTQPEPQDSRAATEEWEESVL